MNQELRVIWLTKTGRPMRNRQWNCTMDLGRVYARAWGTVRAIWNARKTSYHNVRKSTYYCTTYTTLLPTTTTITLWWGRSWIRSLEQISPLRSAENGQTIFIWVIGVSRYRKYCKAQKDRFFEFLRGATHAYQICPHETDNNYFRDQTLIYLFKPLMPFLQFFFKKFDNSFSDSEFWYQNTPLKISLSQISITVHTHCLTLQRECFALNKPLV